MNATGDEDEIKLDTRCVWKIINFDLPTETGNIKEALMNRIGIIYGRLQQYPAPTDSYGGFGLKPEDSSNLELEWGSSMPIKEENNLFLTDMNIPSYPQDFKNLDHNIFTNHIAPPNKSDKKFSKTNKK